MKDQKTKLSKKNIQKKSGWVSGLVKPTGKFLKRYFTKKKKQIPLDQQITDDNWWEWC